MGYSGTAVNIYGWAICIILVVVYRVFGESLLHKGHISPKVCDGDGIGLSGQDKLYIKEIIFLGGLFFSIPFLIHLPHILAGENIVSGDGVVYLFGQAYLKNSIEGLGFPLWCPYLAGGRPWGWDVTVGALYPVNWICSLLPKQIQLCSFFGLHNIVGGVGLLLYFRRLKIRKDVSIAITFIYLFTVHMGGPRKEHVLLIAVALYLPLILYLLESYLNTQNIKWLLGASLAMAMQFYVGFLQYVVYSDIFVGLYLITSCVHRRQKIKQVILHTLLWLTAYFLLLTACIIPMAQLYLRLSTGGGATTDYDTFVTLSLHPIKLLMSVFPLLFGTDVWTGLAAQGNFSSGMDAELVIGGAIVALYLSAIFLVKKNFHVRFMALASMTAVLFACMGNVGPVGRFFYHIPIINLFRVPSRSLFICTLSVVVIAAITTNELLENRNFVRKIIWINMGLLIGFSAVALLYCKGKNWLFPQSTLSCGEVVFQPTIWLLLFCGICIDLRYRKRSADRAWNRTVLAIITISTIAQMLPYYTYSYYSPLERTEENGTQLDLGYSKIWSPDGTIDSLTLNGSLENKVLSINSYTNLNLPYLYQYLANVDAVPMNYSGLYRSYGDWINVAQNKNDVLSMLGIRYLAVSSETNVANLEKITDYQLIRAVIDEKTAQPLTSADGYSYYATPITLEDGAVYHVKVSLTTDERGGDFYIDFYAADYDAQDQNFWFKFEEGTNSYEAYLPVGGKAPKEGALFRIISLAENTVDVNSVLIEEIHPSYSSNYHLVGSMGRGILVENRSAKDMLFPALSVEYITKQTEEDMYLRTQNFDLLNTSYIVGEGSAKDFSAAETVVRNTVLKNNVVSGIVSAKTDTFINMSQCYYPGWVAYIDGERTDVYEVNGLIQGVFVPAGEHLVEFRYRPVEFYIGASISVLTLAIIIAIITHTKDMKFMLRVGRRRSL